MRHRVMYGGAFEGAVLFRFREALMVSRISAIRGIAFFVLLLLVPTSIAADNRRVADDRIAEIYAPFAELLDRFLTEIEAPEGGLVSAFDYAAALEEPETKSLLQQQNGKLAAFDPSTLDRRETAIAFWLNAYNYFMIEYILKNPKSGELVSSVRDYGSLLNPYRVFSRDIFEIGEGKFSLDEIEKEILFGGEYKAKGWKEARVHFAVNCASVGCPPLRAEPYLPGNVDEMLTENTRRALNTPRHLHLEGDTLYVSRLFDWYEDDFVQAQGSVQGFIKAYGGTAVDQAVNKAKRIRYIDYDWDLNRPENFPELKG